MRRFAPALAALLLASPAGAQDAPPQVAATVMPVHSLVARVMEGVGEPALIVPPGASPHGFALRPSEAAALAGAAIVFRIGEGLEPWLDGPIGALAPDAAVIDLAEAPGMVLLPYREGGVWEGHDDDHGDDHAEGEAHGDEHAHAEGEAHGDEHAHAEGEAHGEEHAHAEGEAHGDEHAHAEGEAHGDQHAHDHAGGADPHVWLDPANGAAMLDAIAAELAARDPAHADAYRANAAAGRAELEALAGEIAARAAPLAGRPYVVFHDAYQYFEARFGLPAAGSVTVDGSTVGAARLAAISEKLDSLGAACIFTEPQFPPRLAETLADGTGVRMGTLDPLGAGLAPGPGQYPALLRGLMDGLEACLGA